MKAIVTFVLLGLAYTFQDNELIVRPYHPLSRKSQPIKVEQPLPTVQTDDNEFFSIQNFHEDELISLKKFINKRKIKDYSDLESHTRGNRDALSEVLRILRKKKEKEKEIKKNQKNEKVSQPQTSEKSQENEH